MKIYKGYLMKTFLVFVSLFTLISCSSTPKGEYSRSHIDRPYALPDDVASFAFGVASIRTETTDVTNDALSDVDDDVEEGSLPLLGWENGISDNASWIYPLGFRWGIYENEKHTVGVSFATFLFATFYSIDYWYRLNDKFSLRPFFKNEQITTFIYNDRRDLYGLELVYQAQKHLALMLKYSQGTYEGYSPFIDAIVEDISGTEQDDTKVEGDVNRMSLGGIYSFAENWDFRFSAYREAIELDDFTNNISALDLRFVYFY